MFDTTTFFSVWYWMLTAVFWSMACHFTHGVPYDLLRRAMRLGGEDARLFDALARRSLMRIDLGMRRYGVAAAAAVGFLLAAIGVLAFLSDLELAQGLFLLFAPAAWMMTLSLREALALHRAQPAPDILMRRFMIRRRINQTLGMMAVFFAVAFFAVRHADRIFLYSM